jgi:predicted ribosomally synthesized peptide with nif11-like leader
MMGAVQLSHRQHPLGGSTMSASEAERFANDLKAKPELLDEFKKSASSQGYSGAAEFAKQKGYSIDEDDVKSYISAKAKGEMSDQDLAAIAGGKSVQSVPGLVARQGYPDPYILVARQGYDDTA